MLAAVVDGLAGPRRREDLQRLVEHLTPEPVVKLFARLRQLASEPVTADAHPEREAPSAEPVERHALPGDRGRPPARKGRDHWTEPHLLCGRSDGSERYPRIAHPHGLPPVQVVPHEHPVPARLLRLGRHPGHCARVGELAEQR